jgi:tetratricopeptide (TPR) repeat protein
MTRRLSPYQRMLKNQSSDQEIATVLNNLAVIRLKEGVPAEAEELIDKALRIYDGMKEVNVHHAAALTTKASLLYHMGRYPEALDFFQNALGLTERFFGKNLEYAVGERNISMVYEALGNDAYAYHHMTNALFLIEAILGTDHPPLTNSTKPP